MHENNSKTRIHYWLALKLVPRLAVVKKIALVEAFGLLALFSFHNQRSVLSSANGLSAKQLAAFYQPDWHLIDKIIRACQACHGLVICFDDDCYPQLLKQIYDPPLVLFVQGNAKLLNVEQIAVVGSRSASVNGRETAFLLSSQLAQANIAITSGLALGIDAAAHRGALTGNRGTIAVVATGIDSVYPTRHKGLVQQIINYGGAIVSEFVPGTQARAGHFPKRNRLISGMSLGVLVVEAELKSGSLITARCALEQNREVFAIPSSITNPQARGCHWLIKQGAKLVEQCADIIDELAFTNKPSLHLTVENQDLKNIDDKGGSNKKQKSLSNDALLASVGFEITPVDKVVSRSELPIEEVLTRLTMLELSGLVSAVPGGYIRTQKVYRG
ncbi:DNA-processing protein DprA [Colwelliaceae bacterium MEBiC 14330]